jgi:steroid delta-isomerase-like uncharacterized protein
MTYSPPSWKAIMTTERNKDVVARFVGAVNDRKLDLLDALLTDDFSPPGAPGLSRDALKSVLAYYVSAFPDLHYTIEELVAEGDNIVVRLSMTGTHRGDYQGHAGTGKRFAVDEVDIMRIRDGKIAGYRIIWDEAGFARQLGFG